MAATLSKPPKTMGQGGRDLWQTLTDEFELDDACSRATLLQVCQCVDRLTQISERISREGLVVDTKTGPARSSIVEKRDRLPELHHSRLATARA